MFSMYDVHALALYGAPLSFLKNGGIGKGQGRNEGE